VTENAEQRSRTMRAVRSKNTAPEMSVRRLVFSLGYRYRLHGAQLPGKPDLVFASRKKAIFVHGCFWHGHECRRGDRQPKVNADYWRRKIGRNKVRDQSNIELLQAAGWTVLVVWECQIRADDRLAERLRAFLD
jgi:DNA mismatch endonuclease, patch repair protein